MMISETTPSELSRTIRELHDLRRAMDSAASSVGKPSARKAQLVIHYASISLGIILILSDYFRPFGPTQFLIETHFSDDLRGFAIALIGLVLVLLLTLIYFVVWYSARLNGESFENFASRNFSYLSFVGFVSDLFIKFCATSLVILAGRGDWVAPLLLIFIGDYLIQGRFFILPVRLSFALALMAILLGVLQCLLWYGTLLLPLFALVLLSSMTVWHLAHKSGDRP